MRTHYLKCWPENFAALRDGSKTYEVRRDDRGYCVGDTLRLFLFDPSPGIGDGGAAGAYIMPDGNPCGSMWGNLADRIEFTITHKLPGGQFGIEPGYCVLGLRAVQP